MTTSVPIALDAHRATEGRHYGAVDRRGLVLVLAHGAGAGQQHPFMVGVAQGLASRGIDVVTFDFPYVHERRKIPDKAPVLEACFRAAIAAVQARPDVSASRLFIGGKSMGGRMATHLGSQGVDDLRGIVVFGYPLHPPGRPDKPRVEHLPAIRTPVLIVQGERDAFGTPAELERPLATIPGPVTLHAVAGADHSLAVRGSRRNDVFESMLAAVADWMYARGQSA